MFVCSLLAAGLTVLWGPEFASAQKPLRPDIVFLMIGEVNMCGQAEADKEEGDLEPIPDVLLLNEEGAWEVARHPLNRYSSIRQDGVRNQIGPGAAFAKRMQQNYPGTTVGLIVNARMNTTIDSWSPGSPLYRSTVLRVIRQRNLKLAGIIWAHGESDLVNRNYLESLLKIVAQFRKDFEEPALPFIAAEIHGNLAIVNEYINRLPTHTEFTAVAPGKDLKALNGDQLDRPSQMLLGARLAEAWLGVAAKEFRPSTEK